MRRGLVSTEGAEAYISGEHSQARRSFSAHQTENSSGIGLARPSTGMGALQLTGVQRGWEQLQFSRALRRVKNSCTKNQQSFLIHLTHTSTSGGKRVATNCASGR